MEPLTRELLKTATGAHGEHPSFSAAGCLNRRQRRYTCTACSNVCPAGVFSLKPGEPVKWERCTDCEVCAASCPARCFTPSPAALCAYRERPEEGAPFSLSCLKETSLADKTVRCLAGIPWELLALFALEGPMAVYTGRCESCEHRAWAAQTQENLSAVQAFLGEDRFSARVRLLKSGETTGPPREDPEREMTRIEMFAGVKNQFVKSAGRAAMKRLPLLEDSEEDGMRFRRLLAEAVARERKGAADGEAPRYGLCLPRFTTACYGCGICEKLCPHKALIIGPEQDGGRLIYLTPYLCTACGLCARVCPHGGIAGLHTLPVPDMRRLPFVRVASASCLRCGAAVPRGTEYCPGCSAKLRHR